MARQLYSEVSLDRLMRPELSTVRTRLAAVDPALVSLKDILAAWYEGSDSLAADPNSIPTITLEQARRNPVLGAALGLGAVEAASSQDDARVQALAGLALGIALIWWGSFADALPQLTEAIADLEAGPIDRNLLYARWHHLVCERRLGNRPDTAGMLLAIADELEAQGDSLAAHRCRLDIAATLAASDPTAALQHIKAAHIYFADSGLAADEGIALAIHAHVLFNQGQIEPGHDDLNRAETIFIQQDMPAMLCYAWMERGVYYKHQLQMEKALHWLDAARDRAEALQHDYYQIASLLDIAALLFYRGDVDRSLEMHRTIRQMALANRLVGVAAESELTAANWQFRQGEYEAAAEGYRRARDRYEAFGNRRNTAICTMNLGIVARRLGQFAESLRLLTDALDAFRADEYHEDEAHTHYHLGKTYAAFGYIEPAIDHLKKGMEIAEQAGVSFHSARPAIYLARLLAEQDDLKQARGLLENAARQAQTAGLGLDIALCGLVWAELHLHENRPADALRAYRDSLRRFEVLNQREAVWEAQMGIAAAFAAQSQMEVAADVLDQVPAQDLPDYLRWRYHELDGQIAVYQNQPDAALEAYLDALHTIRDARHSLADEEQIQHFMLSLKPIFRAAYGLAIAANDPFQALLVAELYDGLLLSARLGHAAARDARLDNLPGRASWLLSARLGASWTVLRYVWHDDDLWAFALTQDGLAYYPVDLEARTRMDLRVCASSDDSFRRAVYLHQAETADLSQDSRRRLLEKLIPAPVRDRFEPDHTLIVIPSQQLHGLAFQALLDGDIPLIERTRVLYAQSLDLFCQLLEAPPQQAAQNGDGMILYQTQFDYAGYGPLLHVEREVDAIERAQMGKARRLMLSKLTPQARDEYGEHFDLTAFDWLHIATHAYADPATGTFTGLLLGPDMLDIGHIRHWKLAARLVMLSACQTGLGRWYYGDEIVGLTQAFLAAGAQTVVASLWLAADGRTAELMADFYTLLATGISPVAALAGAQRAAVQAGLDAYYWGPFCAFGLP